MNELDHDPWAARLSEHVDGDLDAAERAALEAHLAGCDSCRALLADLRAVVAAARALPPRAPERDLWPALESALESAARGPRRRAWPLWLAAFAAGVLATLGALALRGGGSQGGGERVARGESWMLLLHEDEDLGARLSEAEHAEIVERYASWARTLGERCVGGDELEERGHVLRPGAGDAEPLAGNARVGGYFLVEVEGEAEALELARTCPHLAQGGWIELRRVRLH